MNNLSVPTEYVGLDPQSILVVSIPAAIISTFSIPLNIFILITTVQVKKIRNVPSNLFIGSLSLSDALLSCCTWLHLPYALSSNETLCKAIGIGLDIFICLGTVIPVFLS